MSKKVLDLVQKTFSDDVLYSHSRLGNDTVVVKRESLVAIMEFLRDDDATKMNFLTKFNTRLLTLQWPADLS